MSVVTNVVLSLGIFDAHGAEKSDEHGTKMADQSGANRSGRIPFNGSGFTAPTLRSAVAGR